MEAANRVPVRKDPAPSHSALCRSVFAVLTSYMAVRGLTDPGEAGALRLSDCESHFDRYGIDAGIPFDDSARARAERKAMQFCLPTLAMPRSVPGPRWKKRDGPISGLRP